MRLIISSIVILLLPVQVWPDQQQTNLIVNDMGFKQNFNIYNWWYRFNFSKNITQNRLLNITENFNSSLLRIRDDDQKWKDDQNFLLDYTWQFTPKLAGKFTGSSLLFSDKLSGITNDIKTNAGSIGLRYRPVDFLDVNSELGYKFDQRFDQLDRGPSYALNVRVPEWEWSDYDHAFDFNISGDEFAIRKNRDFNFVYQVKREFYTDTSDSLSVLWYTRRRDNYDLWDPAKSAIESLYEKLGTISNVLKYQLNDEIKLKIHTELTTKRTKVERIHTEVQDVGRSKKDLRTLNQINLEFHSRWLSDEIRMIYVTDKQRNDIPDSLKNSPFSFRFSYVSPDYQSAKLTLANRLNFHVSPSDSMETHVSISKFQYDTPEEANYDDRDELRIATSASYTHHFSHLLKFRLNLGINLNHLIFIFGEKSADNHWMRIFQLNPELFYRIGDKILLYQTFEVLANYVDYDYEEEMNPADIRSFVFRKFTLQHVLKYQLSRLTTLNLNYRLELEENGKLLWDQWTEMIITTRQSHYGKINLTYQLIPGASFSPGIVFLMRNEQLKIVESDDLNDANSYLSFGPSLEMQYQPHPRLMFSFSGTRRTIDGKTRKSYFINNLNMNLRWYM